MATAAVQLDEESLIREIIVGTPMPRGVRFKKIEPITESTGEDAWRITLAVSKSIPLTKERLTELRDVQTAIRDRVFALKLRKWPFFWLVDAR